MSNANNIRLCIVGTGFSGTAALFHLVNSLTEKRNAIPTVEIITIEERKVNGPGLPYAPSELLPSHLCNNQARVMSVHSNDFCDWMAENRLRLLRDYPFLVKETHPVFSQEEWEPDPDAFYPRALFGIYLRDRFEQTVAKASKFGVKIETLNGFRAIDGFRKSSKFNIVLEEAESGHTKIIPLVDKVLLSTGHWVPDETRSPDTTSTFLDSPYPYSRLKSYFNNWSKNQQEQPLRVFVKGMGPSGIDAILSLAENGTFTYSTRGNITAYTLPENEAPFQILAGSRCGFFPAVRGESVDYTFKYLTKNTFCELEGALERKIGLYDILSMVDAELKEATSGEIGWQNIVKPDFNNAYEKLRYDVACPEVNDRVHTVLLKARRMKFYRHLNAAEKEIYDRDLDTHFIRIAVPIPRQNAEKLIALYEAGVLDSVKMGYGESQNPCFNGHAYDIKHEEHADEKTQQQTKHADAVIRASGQDFKLSLHPSRLVSALVERGELLANREGHYATGGVMLDSDESYVVMSRSPATGKPVPSPHLSSYGVLTRYWQNERNFSAAFVEAALWLAETWTEYCIVQRSSKQPSSTNSN
ncbi:FAD/NAD(P)-binding protein [Vibrio maritimus]|uniref:FAD/NAD(P)-binding protein n=1 Tax=Vibrio maritimus TaxID=990268 RepID=UPI001F35E1F5|nr:FAD/NAD(P)-binding domain-containing protein [Vibrio maritimus]